MKAFVLLLKLLGSLALVAFGYFIHAAVGWPGDLDAMTTERTLVGGAFMLLGALCAVAALKPEKRAPRAPPAVRFEPLDGGLQAAGSNDARPFWAGETGAAPPDHAGEPAIHAAPEAPADSPEIPEPVALTEPVAEPQAEPGPEAPAEELAAPEPATPAAHPSSLAKARQHLAEGDKLFGEGKLDDALDPYGEALDMARDLNRAAPSDETRDLLASALKSIGDVNDETGRLDAATEHYEEALRLRTALLQSEPADPSRQRAVSLVLERLGDTRETRGHVTRALDLYRQSLPIAQGLAASDPESPIYRDDLAATERRIAELEARLATPL